MRASIALGSAGVVGILALSAPGMALGSWSVSDTPAESRYGTTDAFAPRGSTTDRSADREALTADDLSVAASERVAALTSVDDQVLAAQASASVGVRTEALAATGGQIDDEAKRLAVAGTFYWPTAGGINSPWGMRKHPILRYTRLHGGADIGGAIGAPIYAVLDGKVTVAASSSSSGNHVRLDHGTVDGEALETSYLHMNSYIVGEGQTVRRGQLIGYVGNTGLSTAPHLHFSVYVNGANSDPAPYLAESPNQGGAEG